MSEQLAAICFTADILLLQLCVTSDRSGNTLLDLEP